MSTPPTKKQKMDDGKRKVIVLSAPGLEPDVRLLVFDKLEYHVHSVILKLYSGFFRKFLNSPEKAAFDPSSSSAFRYTWTTQIDEDQTWSLVSHPPNENVNDSALPSLNSESEQILEETAFARLLDVMYYKPITINTLDELSRLINMADYYFALQVLSNALDGILLRSPPMIKLIRGNLEAYLEAAYKLRSPILFRECLVLSVGPWTNPAFENFKNKKLRKVAQSAYNVICSKLVKVHRIVLNKSSHHEPNKRDARKLAWDINSQLNRVDLPLYYRRLSCTEVLKDDRLFAVEIGKLLQQNLQLHQGYRAGEGEFADWFLCAEIEDEDLPWDRSQTDW